MISTVCSGLLLVIKNALKYFTEYIINLYVFSDQASTPLLTGASAKYVFFSVLVLNIHYSK